MMEMTKALGSLKKEGIRPRRTLVFCSWDGEEVTLTGSTEWGEHFARELEEKTVAYLNVDSSSSGSDLSVSAVGSLAPSIVEATRSLEDPSGDVRASLEVGKSIPGAGAFVRKRGTKEIFAIDVDPRAELEPRVAPGLPPLLEPGAVPESWSGWESGLVEITIERADGERTLLARRELELEPEALAEGRMPLKWILDPGPAEREAASGRLGPSQFVSNP